MLGLAVSNPEWFPALGQLYLKRVILGGFPRREELGVNLHKVSLPFIGRRKHRCPPETRRHLRVL